MALPSKVSLRARLRARRRAGTNSAVGPETVGSDGAHLARVTLEWLAALNGSHPGMIVLAYISTAHEPPTAELLRACTAAGYKVHVPVCEPDFQLSWVRWDPQSELVRSTLAPVMEPCGPRASYEELAGDSSVAPSSAAPSGAPASARAGAQVLAIIVPALAVDATGARLGQGGGYYDRFLARSPGVPLAAVIYDNEFLPAGDLPHNSLDMPVNYALTPSAWIPLGRAAIL